MTPDAMVLIIPTVGAVHVNIDGVEHIKAMTAHEMMILIERLTKSARITLALEQGHQDQR
jgi:hypothetical protein